MVYGMDLLLLWYRGRVCSMIWRCSRKVNAFGSIAALRLAVERAASTRDFLGLLRRHTVHNGNVSPLRRHHRVQSAVAEHGLASHCNHGDTDGDVTRRAAPARATRRTSRQGRYFESTHANEHTLYDILSTVLSASNTGASYTPPAIPHGNISPTATRRLTKTTLSAPNVKRNESRSKIDIVAEAHAQRLTAITEHTSRGSRGATDAQALDLQSYCES